MSTGRVLYPCARCRGPIDSRTAHVKLLSHVEQERVTATGRRTVTVSASEVVEVRHLTQCKPDNES